MLAITAAAASVDLHAAAAAPAAAPPASAARDKSDITVDWLTGNLYLVQDGHYAATNSLVYIGTSYVTVVGASWTPAIAEALANATRSVTSLPIKEVIDTSPDPEWSGGNAYWTAHGAEVIAAQVTCDALSRSWRDTIASTRKYFPSYPDVPLTMPTTCAANRFERQGGAIRVLFLGPSHTAADVFVYFPKEKVLDAGSILKPSLGNLAHADIAEYPKTLARLKRERLDIRMIIAGHWSAVHGPDLIDRYLALLAATK